VASTEAQDWHSAASFGVEERGWKDLVPSLTDDVIALLAPPVVVSAEAYGADATDPPAEFPAPGQPAALPAGYVLPPRARRPKR